MKGATGQAVFSDVDGTIVHLSGDLAALGAVSEDGASFAPQAGGGAITIRALPPSSTGLQGYISEGTLRLVADLRRAGHVFVLISGARSSTFLERLPFLPAADAYVMENGGRIFYDVERGAALTAAPILEDFQWRATHDAGAGPAVQIAREPRERSGALWDLYRRLEQDGWACDAKGYSTDFRVKLAKSNGKTEADLRAVIAGLPPSLACSFNLGNADFYPATSGKENAARYLMRRWGLPPERCVSMGDDDNDLGLAALVRHTYVPGITADSVRAAVAAAPADFTVASTTGFVGTEEVLQRIAFEFGARARSPFRTALWPAAVVAVATCVALRRGWLRR